MSYSVTYCPLLRCTWSYRYSDDLAAVSYYPHALERVAEAHMDTHDTRDFLATIQAKDDLLFMAWEVIANVGLHQGNWDQQHRDWVRYAKQWRDRWHEQMKITISTHDTEGGPHVG